MADGYYWDQAKIMLNDVEVGRAEGVIFRIIGNWKPYLVPGSVSPEAIYEYGSWITGRIKKAYLDASILTSFGSQFGSTGIYFSIVLTLDAKTKDQQEATPIIIRDAKFDWQLSLELEDYTREDVEFIAKRIG